MKHNRLVLFVLAVLTFVFLPSGCSAPVPQSMPPQSSDVPAQASAGPSAVQQAPETDQSDAQAKEANWVIEIDDTQQITDDEGLIWNYTLSLYASKAGGTDVLGNYTGEFVLDMEPDLNSAKALAAKEGAELLSMLFKHHSEAQDVAFEVVAYSPEAYSELMKENIPDNPLLQINSSSATDALSITRVTFNATQEPISMTVDDGSGAYSGTIPGGKTSVNVPVEISINGADALCYIFETVHPLDRAFKGVITGDVPG
jgi:hypothetical protein